MYPYNNQPTYNQQPQQDQQGNWIIPNNQGFNNQGYNNQGFSQGYPNQGFSNQGFDNTQTYNNQGFSNSNPYGGGGYTDYNNYNNQPVYGGPSFDNNQFGNMSSFSNFDIPDDFIIKEKLLTIGMDMKLLRNNNQFGFIKQKLFSLGRTFELSNSTGAIVAVAKQKLLTIGRDFEIFDSSNTKIGSITEQVLKSILSIHRKYTIRDSNGTIVGATKQLQIFSKSGIEVLNNMGSTQAKFEESWTAFIKQEWKVRFFGNSIDRRLLVFFPSISSQRQEQKNMND